MLPIKRSLVVKSPENSSDDDAGKNFVEVSTVVRNQAVQSFTSTLLILNNSEQLPADEVD